MQGLIGWEGAIGKDVERMWKCCNPLLLSRGLSEIMSSEMPPKEGGVFQ
jgi:hypothetical protein